MKFGQDDPGFVDRLRHAGYTGVRSTYAPLSYTKDIRFGLVTKYTIVFRLVLSTHRLEPLDAELIAPRFDAMALYTTLEGEPVEVRMTSPTASFHGLEGVENFFELIYQRGGYRPPVGGSPLSTIAAMPCGGVSRTAGAAE